MNMEGTRECRTNPQQMIGNFWVPEDAYCLRCHNPRADTFPSQNVLMRYLRDNRNNRVCREENGQCVLMLGKLEE